MLRRGALALAGLALVALMIGWIEPRLVFFPSPGEQATPEGLVSGWKPLGVATEDGETLRAWWLPHAAALADVVYFHGNGGNLSVWLPVFTSLHARGLSVLAVDYRGYGASTGSPSENGLYADARAVVVQHRTLAGAGRPLLYWGRSLGGAVAAYAATQYSPDGLILEATFPDKAAVIRNNPVLRLLNVFGRYEFPTSRFLDLVRAPVLVMHGDADSIIPFPLGREVYEAIPGPKRFVRIPGGDHNDFHGPEDDAYWAPIMSFVRDTARTSER